MRRPLPLVLALVAVAAAAVPAQAQLRPCGRDARVQCARVDVPLDRSGGLAGTVSLSVQRVRPPARSRGTVLALAGGPGQAAIPSRQAFAELLAPILRDRDLVVFDQRGTGASGLLRCPMLETAGRASQAAAVADCATRLGDARSHYTTRDSVADIEAVRQAVGAERISLYGISYGTKVALAYAMAHPQRVERLVLDSVVAPEGPDPFALTTFGAIRRVLRATCARRRCPFVSSDLLADVTRLAERLRTRPLTGTIVGPRGKRRPATLGAGDLLDLLLGADLDPTVGAATPSAVRAALNGDAAAILRLASRAADAERPDEPAELSAGLFAATTCEEAPLPWPRTAGAAERQAEATARAEAIPASAFAPFDRATALAGGIVSFCLPWQPAPAAPDLAGTVPSVPALVLAGSLDTRTPVADAQRVAARLPGGRLLTVTGVGHSVLGSSLSQCPTDAVARFFAGRATPRRCRGDTTEEPLLAVLVELLEPSLYPVPPTRVTQLVAQPGVPGRRRGRTASAALLTFVDQFSSLYAALVTGRIDPERRGGASIGGLRGGYTTLDRRGVRLRRVVYVPGVVVSGGVSFDSRVRDFARLRVSGPAAAHGTIVLTANGRLRGRLDGRRFDVRSPLAGASSHSPAARVAAVSRALRDLPALARRLAARRTLR